MTPALTSVLVIDSHPIMREALCNAIAQEPDLTMAEPIVKGETASQMIIPMKSGLILLAYKPDIILLALGDPGGVDLEILSALQKTLPGTPILALTSNDVRGQEQAALEAGAHAVLTKAAARDEIIHALRELHHKKYTNHRRILEQEARENTLH
jgi:DNA-binding NarL/FixJ family response regulator